LLDLTQRLQRLLRALTAVLDELDNLLEPTPKKLALVSSHHTHTHTQTKYLLRPPSTPNTLIQPTLARRHHRPLPPQPRQRNRNFLLITAAHAVRDDVHLVPGAQEVERGLRDADVAFDADDDAGEGTGVLVEGGLDFGGAEIWVRCEGVEVEVGIVGMRRTPWRRATCQRGRRS
jgi:hypothetical protein